jgi:hypothetical protein
MIDYLKGLKLSNELTGDQTQAIYDSVSKHIAGLAETISLAYIKEKEYVPKDRLNEVIAKRDEFKEEAAKLKAAGESFDKDKADLQAKIDEANNKVTEIKGEMNKVKEIDFIRNYEKKPTNADHVYAMLDKSDWFDSDGNFVSENAKKTLDTFSLAADTAYMFPANDVQQKKVGGEGFSQGTNPPPPGNKEQKEYKWQGIGEELGNSVNQSWDSFNNKKTNKGE